jgi:hypothetical protein
MSISRLLQSVNSLPKMFKKFILDSSKKSESALQSVTAAFIVFSHYKQLFMN